ncbi:T9SS C-terminal target domain-containing protein, partial [bacterium LRH843]|nr:T9SS C-terminal target domain-containing protein [bacterium LRH843]
LFVSASTSIDQLGADIDGEAERDRFGGSVSLSSDGTIIAIGAEQNDGFAKDAGHVRVYEWNGSAWQQKGADIDGEALEDYLGS